jgi:NTF2 fold immunity protein
MMNIKVAFSRAVAGCILVCGLAQHREAKRIDEWEALELSLKTSKTMHPKNGFVPDEATAVQIGEAVAMAQYGEQRISRELPFRARLHGDVWTVMGALHPQGVFGGTAVVKLSKLDGRVLFLIHQE